MDFCKIYVVAHKKFMVPRSKLYVPIQVGNASRLFETGLRDNSGDNIAYKNANYCELTAVYWLWKNVTDVSNIGICHYRRFFARNIWSKQETNLLRETEIKKILSQYDAIVPKKLNVINSVKSFYYVQGEGKEKDINKVVSIIEKKYPEYDSSVQNILTAKKAFYCNMVIISKDNFNKYCEWLFDILFELEKDTDLSGYTVAEARIYGYLSEILLNIWIEHNNLLIKEVPVINTEISVIRGIVRSIKNNFRGVKNKFL